MVGQYADGHAGPAQILKPASVALGGLSILLSSLEANINLPPLSRNLIHERGAESAMSQHIKHSWRLP